jgi:hypothetical protein
MNKLIIALLVLTMTGCSTFRKPEEVVVTNTVIKAPNIPLQPSPRPVNMIDIKWYTVTTDNIDEFEKNFENDNGDLVFFAISVPHYQNLSLNLAEIRRYLEQQQAIIIYYEDQITKSRESINTPTEETPQEQ